MNVQSPFRLKNFDTMKKTYNVFFLVGIVLYFFSEETVQRQRSMLFCILFLVLSIICFVGRRCFINGKYEKISLWLLYLSMMVATIGFPLLVYSAEVSQSFQNFIFNCIIMFFASIIVNVYFIVMRKYGRKLISERFFDHIAAVPILILFFIPVVLMSFDDFINASVWCGIIGLSLTMPQYKRIGAYTKQKNMKRYGNSLDIVNKKKEGEKK